MWNSPTPAGERPEFVGPKGNMAHLVVRNGQFRPSRALVVVDERHQTSKRASSGKQRLESLATRGPLGREGSTSDQMMSNMDFVGVQVFFSLTRHAFIFGVRSTNLGSELPKRGRCITPSVLIVSSIKPFGSKEYISPRADKVSRVSGWTIVSIIFCFVAANCGRASDRSTSARCKRSVILSGPSADQR